MMKLFPSFKLKTSYLIKIIFLHICVDFAVDFEGIESLEDGVIIISTYNSKKKTSWDKFKMNLAEHWFSANHETIHLPPAIFSAKSITICVKLTGPGASESMPWASPSETDLPTELKAATMSEEDKRPSLSASMIPKASLNSWICLWEKRAKTLEPLFLAFLKFQVETC